LDLAQFAFSPNSNITGLASSPLRRSPRKSSGRIKGDSLTLSNVGDGRFGVKRSIDAKSETGSSKQSPKSLKRTSAPPETYAHLSGLQDWLKEDLDVMFCGIK